jgi:hypothetical protein
MIDSAPMRSSGVRLAVIAVACAIVLGACGGGGGSDQQSARDVAQEYVDARNQGDAGKVCELYSDELKSSLRTSDCVAFVKEQTSGVATRVSLVGVQQTDDQARATIRAAAGGETSQATARVRIDLARQDGDWRITSVGAAGGGHPGG